VYYIRVVFSFIRLAFDLWRIKTTAEARRITFPLLIS
jgi:hypothetical protein